MLRQHGDPISVGLRLVAAAVGKGAAVPPTRTVLRGSVEGSVSRGVGWGLGPRYYPLPLVLTLGPVGEIARVPLRLLLALRPIR